MKNRGRFHGSSTLEDQVAHPYHEVSAVYGFESKFERAQRYLLSLRNIDALHKACYIYSYSHLYKYLPTVSTMGMTQLETILLSELQLSFPSPRLVDVPRLKSLVCLTVNALYRPTPSVNVLNLVNICFLLRHTLEQCSQWTCIGFLTFYLITSSSSMFFHCFLVADIFVLTSHTHASNINPILAVVRNIKYPFLGGWLGLL